MRPKTLFRVLVKAIGVWLIATAIPAIASLMTIFPLIVMEEGIEILFDTDTFFYLGMYAGVSPAGTLVQLALGCYLFFGGKWIVNRAVPHNRIYCPRCGYEIRSDTPDRCPECDAPLDDPTTRGPD